MDLGIIESVGFVAEYEDIRGFLEVGGYQALSEADLHKILGYYCNPTLEKQSETNNHRITSSIIFERKKHYRMGIAFKPLVSTTS